eukprot:g266.t1
MAANFDVCARLVSEAAERGCAIVFFPEGFACIGARKGDAQRAAEPLDGPMLARYAALARRYRVWLSLGGFPEAPGRSATAGDGDCGSKVFNTHVVFDAEGTLRAAYRKLHLFDVPAVGLVESAQARAGDDIVACDSPVGRLGLSVCYDVRFPSLYQRLRFECGADVLLVPSAFAVRTGAAHWETLLRCRAVECQCYVVGAAQAGQHSRGEGDNSRRSFGRAVAYGPWGEQVAQFPALDERDGSAECGVAVFSIDLGRVRRTREQMPLHLHRRAALYDHAPAPAPARAPRALQQPLRALPAVDMPRAVEFEGNTHLDRYALYLCPCLAGGEMSASAPATTDAVQSQARWGGLHVTLCGFAPAAGAAAPQTHAASLRVVLSRAHAAAADAWAAAGAEPGGAAAGAGTFQLGRDASLAAAGETLQLLAGAKRSAQLALCAIADTVAAAGLVNPRSAASLHVSIGSAAPARAEAVRALLRAAPSWELVIAKCRAGTAPLRVTQLRERRALAW